MIFACFVGRFVRVKQGRMFIERKVRVFSLSKMGKIESFDQNKEVRNH